MSDEDVVAFIETLVVETRDMMRQAGLQNPVVLIGFSVDHGETFKQAAERIAAKRRSHAH